MVQATSQFVALLTLALGTLTTGYAAPTARSCDTTVTAPFFLTAQAAGSTAMQRLELFETSTGTGTSDYVLTVCPNNSCTSTDYPLDWLLNGGVLSPQSPERTIIDLPLVSNAELGFRALGNPGSETSAANFCVDGSSPGTLNVQGQADQFWLCPDPSATPRQVVWFQPTNTAGCQNVNIIATSTNSNSPVWYWP